ncbi:MAG: glutamine--fructose-6-phosphate transaminase (isomerizing) [Chloroflexi bacterium]|nr:glutamine--fructose-6-phosphate transaminase (isomerizing) [Chloroflexota bacterium]
MCGIVGYAGSRSVAPILLDGLRQLEYRGYDSAGIAVLAPNGQFGIQKAVGKLDRLVEIVGREMPPGTMGIGHTRWATHGKPSDTNAHPHVDCQGNVVVIHNGIIENYIEIKHELQAAGHVFASQTDTEVVPHLVEQYLSEGDNLEAAVRRAVARLAGAHAFLIMSRAEPDKVIAVRMGNAGGIVIGLGEGETFVASDLPAVLPHTRRAIFLDNREMAVITADGPVCSTVGGRIIEKVPTTVPYDPIAAAKSGYRHFMLKEIMEQPRSITDTIRGRVGFEPPEVFLPDMPFTPDELRALERVTIVACGTSWHAGLVGKFMIESLAGLPVEVDYASEFRYRDPLIDRRTLLVSITQSGETVDTLAAMEMAKTRGLRQVTICNVVGSQATRVADGVIYTNAGPEIGVASTKAFTAQLTGLYLLAAYLGRVRGVLGDERLSALTQDLVKIPHLIGQLLEKDNHYLELAQRYFDRSDFLYLGRGINYPIALEGALKLKEISYVHAEGYPAGEMKHGPIALIDRSMPVVAIAVRDGVYDKMLSNVEQVKTRDGIVIALATEGDTTITEKADHVIYLPPCQPLLAPILTVIPLQLLAYHIAIRRGCDVDQPRNLAKSVTVE